MSNSSLSHRPADVVSWAEIRAHDRVTRYRRLGTGRPLVVLHSPGIPADRVWPELLEALSSSYRLIVPEIPDNDPDTTRRIADFLEGLGCTNVGLVAGARFRDSALELAVIGCDNIGRVVVIVDAAGPDGVEPDAVGGSTPVLVVRLDQPVAEVLRLVRDFLGR